MKKTLAKILALALCAVLLVTGTVFVTLAYLQDHTGVVKNTFTAGNVTITLKETKVTEYGEPAGEDGNPLAEGAERVYLDADEADTEHENKYKIVPDAEYVKDPTVIVEKGSEPCYVIIAIKDSLFGEYYKAPTMNTGGDSKGTSLLESYYTMRDGYQGTVYDQIKHLGWKELTFSSNISGSYEPNIASDAFGGSLDDGDYRLFYYCTTDGSQEVATIDASKAAVELPIFEGFKLKGLNEDGSDDIIDKINTAIENKTPLAFEVMAFAVQTNLTGASFPALVDNVAHAFISAFTTSESA